MTVDEVALMATAMGCVVFRDNHFGPLHVFCQKCGLYLVYVDPNCTPPWLVWDMTGNPHRWRQCQIADVIDRLENPP